MKEIINNISIFVGKNLSSIGFTSGVLFYLVIRQLAQETADKQIYLAVLQL